MAIYDFFLSRNNAVSTPANYVGHSGRLFYDSTTGVIKLSDGVTPGGLSIPYTIATNDIVGGIKAGPGIVIDSEGTLFIDTEGLEFSFGDFTGTAEQYTDTTPYALLGSINADEDIVIASNGVGVVKVVGGFEVYKTDGNVTVALDIDPVFTVSNVGQITATTLDITNIADLEFKAPLNVSINADGLTKVPAVISGAVAQFTGRDDRQPALVIDAYGVDGGQTMTGGKVVFRTGRGTNASTTSIQSGDRLGTFAAAGWASNGYAGIDSASIIMRATDNFTSTARGANVEIRAVATGTTTPTSIAVFDANIGVTSTLGFVGNISGTTGTFIGNIYAGNVISNTVGTVYGNVVGTTGAFTGNVSASYLTGKLLRGVRNAGTIGDGGTLTIDFSTDAIVYCVWGNGMTMAYQNFMPGRIVKVMATKATGTGTDTLNLDGVTAARVSTGSTTLSGTADQTSIMEFICTNTSIGSVFVKL